MNSHSTKNAGADREDEVLQAVQKANDEMRQDWNSAVCEEFDVPNHYQSVSVLLIHWAAWLDESLGCGEEVSTIISCPCAWFSY